MMKKLLIYVILYLLHNFSFSQNLEYKMQLDHEHTIGCKHWTPKHDSIFNVINRPLFENGKVLGYALTLERWEEFQVFNLKNEVLFKRVLWSMIDQLDKRKVDSMYSIHLNQTQESLDVFLRSYKIANINQNRIAAGLNGACGNIDFEQGLTEWTGDTARNCSPAVAGGALQKCNLANMLVSPRRHLITTKTMTDPYIPTLSTVFPAKGLQSLRLEDYQAERDRTGQAGGVVSSISHSFTVTSDNNLLTYHYAVVLEDPGNDPNHQGYARPHFLIRLKRANGQEIPCATYTVVVNSDLSNFKLQKVGTGNAAMNLYYRDWNSVSIPLTQYMGENLTITFSVSDCAPGGHLGYAYLDGECAPIAPPQDTTICGDEIKKLQAPTGFATYAWVGPGIVGNATSQSVSFNKAGVYTVTLTPFADDPCPITLKYTVVQICPKDPISDTLCATTNTPLSRSGINLNAYNNQILALYNTTNTPVVSIKSWHSAKPATNANRINNPTNVVANNLQKFYAVTSFPDTVELNFVINRLPNINFPNPAALCEGGPVLQIANVTPSGGVFSGNPFITSLGVFNPSVSGTYNIKYKYTTVEGCADSLTKSITVIKPASINAPQIDTMCQTIESFTLSSTSTGTVGVQWSGGSGRFSDFKLPVTTYFPANAEKSSTNGVVFVVTGTANSPCPLVKDTVKVFFAPLASVEALPNSIKCANVDSVALIGIADKQKSVVWSGGSGVFKSTSSLKTVYFPSKDEKKSKSPIILNLVANSSRPCPVVTDTTTLRFVQEATVAVPNIPTLCNTSASVTVSGNVQNAASVLWNGGNGKFDNPKNANTIYNFTASELLAATPISLILTVTPEAPCPIVKDTLVITLSKQGKLDALPLPKYCIGIDSIPVTATTSDIIAVKWSGGKGAFVDAEMANSIYIPSLEEKKNAIPIIFSISGVSASPCPIVNDTVSVKFVEKPVVDVFAHKPICASQDSINISFKASFVENISWETLGSIARIDTRFINFNLNDIEKSSGSLKFKAIAKGFISCPEMVDSVLVMVSPEPQGNILPLADVCSDTSSILLSGTVKNVNMVKWTGGVDGQFLNSDSPVTKYVLGPNDKKQKQLNFKLTMGANLPCPDIQDSVDLDIVALPSLGLSPVQKYCEDITLIPLTLSSENLQNLQWYGSGGTFTASNQPSTQYQPAFVEKRNGSSKILVLGEALSPCKNLKDSVLIQYVRKPKSEIGTIDSVCIDQDVVLLKGEVSNVIDQYWIGGQGMFSDKQLTSTEYKLSEKDKSIGQVEFKLVAKAQAPCRDTIAVDTLIINPLPDTFSKHFTFCADHGNSLKLDAGDADQYLWLRSNDTSRFIVVAEKGVFEVEVTNKYGCKSKRTIETLIECPPQLYISNAFSPNSDGANDKYTVFGEHIGAFHMLIFNRWGEIIFESNEMSSVWDGNYRGEEMPIGVYEWLITYEGDSEKYRGPYKKKGSVTVIR